MGGGGGGGGWAADATTRAELWDGLRSNPSDGVSGLFCAPLPPSREKSEECPLQPPKELNIA